jgi:hypothetical protein
MLARSNAAATDQAQQNSNHGDNKQNMNQASQGKGGDQAKEPQNNE